LSCPDGIPTLEATMSLRLRVQTWPQYANGDAGMQERLGWRDEASDPDKGAGQAGVIRGGGMQPGHVGAGQPDLEGSMALNAGEDQVAAKRSGRPRLGHSGSIGATVRDC
jgi:hypothetical protein